MLPVLLFDKIFFSCYNYINEEIERFFMSNKVVVGSLYEMNQQLFKQMALPSKKKIDLDFANIGAWFSSHKDIKYYMLLCKERSDYTIFHFNGFNFNKAVDELRATLEERGDIMGIDYIHGDDVFQCWVRERGEDPDVYMFMLFDANWMVVEI